MNLHKPNDRNHGLVIVVLAKSLAKTMGSMRTEVRTHRYAGRGFNVSIGVSDSARFVSGLALRPPNSCRRVAQMIKS